MMAKKSCVEDTTRHLLLQQVCHTHEEEVIAGASAIGGKASCAYAAGLYR
jgi:hypothetical protein